MTLQEIINQLPEEGMTTDVPRVGDPEDRMDHMLEHMYLQYTGNDEIFKAGLSYAAHVLAVAMTMEGLDWASIRRILEALTYHLDN